MDLYQVYLRVSRAKARLHTLMVLLLVMAILASFGWAGMLWWKQHPTEDEYVAEPMPAVGATSTSSESPRPDPGIVAPSSTPAATSSATVSPSASPSPTKVAVQAIAPDRIVIPSLKVNTAVLPKPTENRYSSWLNKTVPSFGVPDRTDKDPVSGKPLGDKKFVVTTWWSSGPKVGTTNANGALAIILGHTQINGYGVFNDLGKMENGDPVITSSGGTATVKLKVKKVVTAIDKRDESALMNVLQNPPEGAVAALITCSGLISEEAGHQSRPENTVVFLELDPLQGLG